MPQSSIRKNVTSFNRGFNSDAGPLEFPEGNSLDELNYDILIDGTRRRRKGLEVEEGSPLVDLDFTGQESCRTFKWPAAGDSPLVNFIIIKIGRFIRFYEDLDDGSVGDEKSFSINLTSYKTSGTTDEEVDEEQIDIAASRGKLVIVGERTTPIIVGYDVNTDTISVSIISLRERDLYGIEDGVPNTTQPSSLSLSHQYNLINQGWTGALITQYFTDTTQYPAKNQVLGRGFRRQEVVGIADIDGTKEFSSDKLIAELFQDAPAPMGHFLTDPFNTALGIVGSSSTLMVDDASVNDLGGGDFSIVMNTTTNHGLIISDLIFTLGPIVINYISTVDGTAQQFFIGSGFQFTVDNVPGVMTLETNTLPGLPFDFGAPQSLAMEFGIVTGDEAFTNPQGVSTSFRPSTCCFAAGRVWYAGVNSGRLTTKIFFSQVIETEAQYGKCYQVADPTDENISDLIATDGGSINIPEMGVCFRLLPYDNGILVFSFNGIWYIGPGERGYFTADSYSVRKVSEVGVDGPASIVVAETIPFYWGRNSIYRIARDTNTGFLTAMNMSIRRIDNFFNAISNLAKRNVQAAYDPLLKKIYWIYRDLSTAVGFNDGFNRILLYDLKYDAFIKFSLPRQTLSIGGGESVAAARSIFAARTPNPNNPDSTIKIFYERDTDCVFTNMSSDNAKDFFVDGEDNLGFDYDAYIITGFDTGRQPALKKQALYITVFSIKTENGYEEVSGNLIPVNESSTIMQTRWDWANHQNSGKWGSDQEVYRHARLYTPVDDTDTFDSGEYLVITRNKVRGRGRALHIKFTAGQGKHSHIAGWTTNYRILTEE